jgi:uncharacterized protein
LDRVLAEPLPLGSGSESRAWRDLDLSGATMAVQQNTQAEPSMEDILASIRRIISEDDDQARRPPEPVLELNKPAPAPAPASAASAAEDLLVFEDEPTPVAMEPPPPPVARAPIPAPEPPPSLAADIEDAIVSPQAVTAAASAFTRLSGSLRIAEAPGQTIEGVVRELLRPMLKEWLEAHLPAIVEAKVEAEVERIVRMSR